MQCTLKRRVWEACLADRIMNDMLRFMSKYIVTSCTFPIKINIALIKIADIRLYIRYIFEGMSRIE
jgi:hypothetical protein